MKLLVGSTGLIGTTLQEKITFDLLFNSKNIEEFKDVPDNCDLYLCCLPAQKYLVNKNPLNDFNLAVDIFNILRTKKYNKVYLFSTIDVYLNSPELSTENTIPGVTGFNYGVNRYLFEILIKNLSSQFTQIIRLPALYGKHIKKNILFDLLNNNQVTNISINSAFQWYDLNDLINDIKNSEGRCIVNLFPEPVETREIVNFFPEHKKAIKGNSFIKYNYCTVYSDTGYIYNKMVSLLKIERFINEVSCK